jgi:uncharacterized membrane protein YqaE (UPF0057 family)
MKKIFSFISTVILFTAITANAAVIVPVSESAKSNNPVKNETVKSAIADFKNLSRSERKSRINQAKTAIKDYKATKSSGGSDMSTNQLLLIVLSILLPPLAVYLHENAINGKFWLDLVLTLIFWLPGIIYSLIVVLS